MFLHLIPLLRSKLQLTGFIDIFIDTEDSIETLRIDAKEFSWEDGGEYDNSFLFIYYDNADRFNIYVKFSLQDSSIINWSIESDLKDVTISNDSLEIPSKFITYNFLDFL
jgi:hypothetical protein